ncbi:MFS transporter [Microbacterium oleivorans]|uniref:Permease of the major facilitator superfamily protein n=1 Tax=Microbacterium oleivorans TaxID=273677 RepID=A0A031FZU9_9MICO|nr:MFS transporter [Microbacterium oleivorans]EZP29782.1 Permease of the major facilitator superfamily protein [Microbacterium oleivorans]
MTTTTTGSVTGRLDRLPFTRTHLRVLTGSGAGWALDAMDVGLISFVIAALVSEWDLTPSSTSWIASAGFAGMAIGATVGGLLADRIGRRSVFALTLLVYGVATGASALSGGLVALIALRFVVGLGLGAELPVASTYVSEFAPARMRGRIIVVLEAFWAIGWTASALIGYLVIPSVSEGWRWALAIGAIPAVYALVVRWGLPESPRWLASRGRTVEADRIVTDLESSRPLLGTSVVTAAPAPASTSAPATTIGMRLRGLWAPDMRVRTAALWVVWFCVNFAYYGAFIWIPTLLVSQGFGLVRSFEFTLLITLAQLPGYAVAAWLIEKWGRRLTLSVFLVGSAVAAILFGQATTIPLILATGMALSFFNLGAWGALYAVTPETYSTTLRATGAGWAAGVGRIASILAPPAVPALQAVGGIPLVFIVLSVFFLVAAAATWGLAESRGRSLAD